MWWCLWLGNDAYKLSGNWRWFESKSWNTKLCFSSKSNIRFRFRSRFRLAVPLQYIPLVFPSFFRFISLHICLYCKRKKYQFFCPQRCEQMLLYHIIIIIRIKCWNFFKILTTWFSLSYLTCIFSEYYSGFLSPNSV